MRWIRSNLRELTHLALFALTVQIIVTFGHVHPAGATLAPTQALQSATVAQAVAPAAKPYGRDQKSHGTADYDCPICALIQLASTSVPAVAPAFPTSALLGGTVLEALVLPIFTASAAITAYARGPPPV